MKSYYELRTAIEAIQQQMIKAKDKDFSPNPIFWLLCFKNITNRRSPIWMTSLSVIIIKYFKKL